WIENPRLAERRGLLDRISIGRLLAERAQRLAASSGQKHLLGDLAVIDVGLQIAPALHLREDPDRHRLVRKRVEIDPVRYVAVVAEPVGEHSGEHLFEYLDRLIQEVARRD